MKKMKFCLHAFLAVAALGLGSSAAFAQAITGAGAVLHLNDGKTVTPTAIRRSGANVMATVPVGSSTGEVGYAISSIARIDFPETPQIGAATDLLAQSKAQEALTVIQPVYDFFQPYAEVPGNRWAPAALVKLNALNALGREAEAAALTAQLARISKDPELLQIVQLRQAKDWISKGEPEKAIEICNGVIEKSKTPETLAYAWLNKGAALEAKADWEAAAIAYLHVTVFFPTQKLLLPPAMLGAARSIAGMDDAAESEKRFQAVIDTFPASPEAAVAKTVLAKRHP